MRLNKLNLLIGANKLSIQKCLDQFSLSEKYFATVIDLENKNYLISNDKVDFENLIDLLKSLEKAGTRYEHIIISGGLLNFSSEINIRIALCGLIGIAREKVIYFDRSVLFENKVGMLSRCLNSINIHPKYSPSRINGYSFIDIEIGNSWSSFENEIALKKISNKRLSFSLLIEKLEQAIENSSPFSFIRINHCENRLLGYGNTFSIAEANITYDIQFGYKLDEDKTNYISHRIKDSVRNSDVLGVPTPKPLSTNKLHLLENTTFIHFMRYSLLREQYFMSVNTHYDLGQDLRFKYVLNMADKVIAITCRDISALSNHINKKIQVIKIPSENRFSDKLENERHFPDRFYEIEKELSKCVHPKTVVLVGAGILAKIYCDIVKSHGGIAIDVGSLMDAIEDVNTRGDGFASFKFWW
jgi:hypothetical protein